MQTVLHFSRFEFKYVLRQNLRDELEKELGYFMGLDPFVEGHANHKYFVRSLYFDDDLYTNYYEKTDGVLSRHKYRIRTYTDNVSEDCVAFLEVKGRFNALVYKHRVQLPKMVNEVLGRGCAKFLDFLAEYDISNNIISNFLFSAYRTRLKPNILIDYNRRPYISKYAPGFRVTFDDALQSARTDLLFNRETDRQRIFLPGYTIVEVKFKRHIPSWFHRLIQSYELCRISVSKYCQGVEACGLAVNLE